MNQTEKMDKNLGAEIQKYLTEKGIATPTIQTNYSEQEKIERIETYFKHIMVTLGLDLSDDSLIDTPKRVAKMFVNEVFWGLDPNKFPKCTAVENKMGYNDLIVEKCTVKSNCEHHLVYFGTAHNPQELGCWVAYIPDKKVIGLSKLSRIVDYFSRRPQIQERLTEQIAHSLKYILQTENVAVVLRAQHFCVLTRGIQDDNSYTVTSSLHGSFMSSPALRSELMSIVNR